MTEKKLTKGNPTMAAKFAEPRTMFLNDTHTKPHCPDPIEPQGDPRLVGRLDLWFYSENVELGYVML